MSKDQQELKLYSMEEMELFRDVALIKERNAVAEDLMSFGNDTFMPYGARLIIAAAARKVLSRSEPAPDTEKAPAPDGEEPRRNCQPGVKPGP